MVKRMDLDNAVDVRLKAPFTAVVAGPTGSGKTEMVQKMIANSDNVCDKPPVKILYRYGAWQKRFEEKSSPLLEYGEGMIDVENDIPNDGQHRWLIIDDLMDEVSGKTQTNNLFTKHSHHKNLSVFFLVQNFFHKNLRSVTLNAHYMFLFKNPRDASQINHLGRQLFPTNPKFLGESYVDATKEPYSFLTVDLKQNTKDEVRVLGNYLSDDKIVAYYWK